MLALTLELADKGTRQTFTKNVIKIGRVPTCDYVLSAQDYPMVGREHLTLHFDGRQWWAEDLKSANGTFLNGNRIQRGHIAQGDILKLGSDGPEIRVQFAGDVRVAPTQASASAVQHRSPNGYAETQPSARSSADHGENAPTHASGYAPTKPSARRMADESAAYEGDDLRDSRFFSGPERTEANLTKDEDMMIEKKLDLLRNLLVIAAVLVVILGAIVISQMQQISDIQKNLTEMRTEAHSAVGKFYPELDARLNTLQSNMDSMDQKMQQAEDRFVHRMDQEMPVIMDKYLKVKLDQARSEIQKEANQNH